LSCIANVVGSCLNDNCFVALYPYISHCPLTVCRNSPSRSIPLDTAHKYTPSHSTSPLPYTYTSSASVPYKKNRETHLRKHSPNVNGLPVVPPACKDKLISKIGSSVSVWAPQFAHVTVESKVPANARSAVVGRLLNAAGWGAAGAYERYRDNVRVSCHRSRYAHATDSTRPRKTHVRLPPKTISQDVLNKEKVESSPCCSCPANSALAFHIESNNAVGPNGVPSPVYASTNAVSISQPIHSPIPPATTTPAESCGAGFKARRASHARRGWDSERKYCLRSGLWKNAWRIAERKHVWERLRSGRIAGRARGIISG
jgi:hypothetical protein